MKQIVGWMRRDPVLSASFFLALISMLWVRPSAAYIGYVDFRVLGILLSLMLVMAGFQRCGFFELMGGRLLRRCGNITQLCLVLTFLCFFSSMLITNDVALITFVPFAVMILKKSGREELMIPVIVSQTLAANLGSMLTPLGNPQNLYIYNLAGYSFAEFVRLLFPYTLAAGVLLFALQILTTRNVSGDLRQAAALPVEQGRAFDPRKSGVYGILFALCLLTVFRVLPYYVVLAVIIAAVFCTDRRLLAAVDYSLLFTFTFFFVFTGNLGRIDAVRQTLQGLVSTHEVLVGILASQFISNVPAALLLSGFTEDLASLAIGVDLGGVGTLFASMASLISYKLYAGTENARKGRYLLVFTGWNLLFLAALTALHLLLSGGI